MKIANFILHYLIFISYSIMFYFEKSLDYVDYIGYIVVAIILPIWLIFTKFK